MTLDEYKQRLKHAEEAQLQILRQNQTQLDIRRESIKRNIGEGLKFLGLAKNFIFKGK